jgi:hypothetical protein
MMGDLKIGEMWFSFDHPERLDAVKRVARLLEHVKRRKKRIYVMVGYGGETVAQADARLKTAWLLGYLPFAQYYRGLGDVYSVPTEWRSLIAIWSRPAATISHMGLEEVCGVERKEGA